MSVPDPANALPAVSLSTSARVVVAARRRARREQLATALRRVGYQVRASDPTAVAALSNRTDVVVLEWAEGVSLPGRGGPPVIALIPRDRADQVMRAIEAGVADYVLGPATADELVARVELAARRRTAPSPRGLGGRSSELTLRCAADGTIISATGSARAIVGLSNGDLVSLPWPGLAHEEDAAQVALRLAEAFAAPDEIVAGTHRVRRGEDRYAWVETRCRVAGGVAEIVVRDVTGAKRERDRETGLRRIATMIARRDDLEAIAAAAVELACRLLDARGAALRGPDGIIATSGVIEARATEVDQETPGTLSTPITVEGERWGAVAVNAPGAGDSAIWLGSLADLMALHVSRRAEGPASAVTTVDRGEFAARLAREATRAARYRRPLAVALLDVADRQNDGLADISGAAERLRSEARAGESVAVLDRGRLAWLLLESGAVGAWQAVERVRCAMALRGRDVPSLVAGVATLGPGEDPAGLLPAAERALGVARIGGGDAAVIHTAGLAAILDAAANRPADAVATLADELHPAMSGRSREVAAVATAIAAELGWSGHDLQRLREAALVYDIGKAALPVDLLERRGRLDAAELCLMQSHADIGARLGARTLSPEQVAWIRGHHERWDGEGYPDALAGSEIPEGARILAVADAFLAMRSDRAYGAAMDTAGAREECARCAGAQFWPDAVDALSALVDRGRVSEVPA